MAVNLTRTLKDFFSVVYWCLKLSWKTSKTYTLIRMIADVKMPLLVIAAAFVGRSLIDILADGGDGTAPRALIVILLILILVIALLRKAAQHFMNYSQSMQSEMLSGQITLDMMNRAFSADIEYFDNPAYHDRLQSAT